jgi:TetR/AcrR family transcriptional regulator
VADDLRLDISRYAVDLERDGVVTRTFRRLDEDRQRSVLDAIMAEAAVRGPAAINLKDIAGRAGVSVGSLYQYFGSREGLLRFAVAVSVRYMLETLMAARAYLLTMPLSDALRVYVSVGVEWGTTEAGLMRFLGRAAYQGDPELRENAVRPIATAMRELLADVLRAAAERGELRDGLDVAATARLANALAIAVTDSRLFPYLNDYFQVVDESMPSDRVLEAFVEFVMSAVTEV